MNKVMKMHNKATQLVTCSAPSRFWQRRTRCALLVAACAWLTLSCVSQSDKGNTGSETHWLNHCSADADCEQGSCLCGICTAACSNDEACQRSGDDRGVCTAKSELQCEASAPAKLCALPASVESDSGKGDSAKSDSGTGDSAKSDSGESEPIESEPIESEPSATNPQPSSDAAAVPPTPRICDGSDEIRFVMQTNGGGPLPGNVDFFLAYGWSFLAIDGQCHFWLSQTPGEFGEGDITEASLLQVYEEESFGQLAQYADIFPPQCPDGPSSLLWDSAGSISGDPGCSTVEDPGWRAAFDGAQALFDALAPMVEPSQGPLRVSLQLGNNGNVAWPLELDPTPILTSGPLQSDSGVLFPSGPDAESLRAARAATEHPRGEMYFVLSAEADADTTVHAYLRDEPPALVRSALEAASWAWAAAQNEELGMTCTLNDDCQNLACAAPIDATGELGATVCSACVTPESQIAACTDNADCCAGLMCCVDCGELSGTCRTEVDVCSTCLNNGGAWQPLTAACTADCGDSDAPCFTDECPSACADDRCGSCFSAGDCWRNGCTWLGQAGTCVAPLESEPCSVDASDPSLPGVTIHLEADRCDFFEGQGGQFRYRVEQTQSLDFNSPADDQGTGKCRELTDLVAWVSFVIGNETQSLYCPACDEGPCPPNDATAVTLPATELDRTVLWPGLQWHGESDTYEVPSGTFAPGAYTASVTMALPDLGEVKASLPITVVAAE